MPKKPRKPRPISQQLQEIILHSEFTRYRIGKMANVNAPQLHRFVTTGKGIGLETLDRIGQALKLRLVVDADPDANE